MSIQDLNKAGNRYYSFEDYAVQNKVRYNKKLFMEEEMYFCKIWKAHRVPYKRIVEHYNWANDINKLNARLEAYETRLGIK